MLTSICVGNLKDGVRIAGRKADIRVVDLVSKGRHVIVRAYSLPLTELLLLKLHRRLDADSAGEIEREASALRQIHRNSGGDESVWDVGVPEVVACGNVVGYSSALYDLGLLLRGVGVPLRSLHFAGTLRHAWSTRAAEVLKKVHAAGLVHGDLKPDHFVVNPGDVRQLLLGLIDFGGAVRVGDAYELTTEKYASLSALASGIAQTAHDLESVALCFKEIFLEEQLAVASSDASPDRATKRSRRTTSSSDCPLSPNAACGD